MKPSPVILVLGLGASGEAAARLALADGARVCVADAAQSPALDARAAALRALGAVVHLGGRLPSLDAVTECVVSPGISDASDWIQELRARGIPCVSEIEFGWRRRRTPTVAITGSNGKTTAVRLLAESLRAGGLRVAVAGNIGTPVCDVARANPALDWMVLEISSFQLETCNTFRPDIGILLNVQPNHLDRHGSMAVYRALKYSLFARQQAGDLAIVPGLLRDDVRAACPESGGEWIGFGLSGEPEAVLTYAPGQVNGFGPPPLSLSGTDFDNEILGPAVAAVGGAASRCGVPAPILTKALRDYVPLPHRMQRAGILGGVRYVNNSKATSLAAMMASLRMTTGPVRLIAGGRPKETDWSPAREMLVQREVAVYLIGEAAAAMFAAWSDAVPCVLCGSLEEAVRRAASDARNGDTVLLAPACASFDQFASYAERGTQFMRRVEALGNLARESRGSASDQS